MKKLNNKGLSLIEVIISLAISSIVLLMLTQMLSMNLQMKNKIEIDNILYNQSSNITNAIKNDAFDIQAQKIELQVNTDSGDTRQVILISHIFDVKIDTVSGEIIRDILAEPIVHELVYDPDLQQITLDGNLIHSEHIKITDGSTITVIPRDKEVCESAEATEYSCEGVILKLDLQITYQRDLTSETTLIDPKQFVSTIII